MVETYQSIYNLVRTISRHRSEDMCIEKLLSRIKTTPSDRNRDLIVWFQQY